MRFYYRRRGSPWGCSAAGWLVLFGLMVAVGLLLQLLQYWWLVLLIGAFVLSVNLWRQP